mmetsp:Transcript_10304/g.31511  ORF Transcript_10304/g.31511 Transcript_10304/m.31511 type:complete len:356 (+) Transcript_10304:565-1632(+)|eukprot:CAMPEP_0198728060 /NCGR_PEP_ID=MMETSP1475-20131203/6692_1 /TAXON_ID= ORGANISM="Unidentified sp., Strain CCMP1999" /NCGR_SAMPLE_ID=MMETSP1475 /ASSEMBLY_ACC=CAM_ASM_001111 /LENGTH=355 /DNA_ID=CAMNT_0044490307 /DNA_START=563 /DNA_END=1630 /DNA_ORIENTATION=+
MKTVELGKQGLEVSELGYGCMGLTSAYGTKLPDDEIVALLEKVYEKGINFWDTALFYCYSGPDGSLESQEKIIADAIKKVGRENVVISAKLGLEIYSENFAVRPKGDPDFVKKQCEESLAHLDVDCLDVLVIARIDQDVPIEITMAAVRDLVNEGKVKYVGLSECSADTIRRAHKVFPLSCVQMEYSLWSRDLEEDVIPTCAELGIGLVAYSPLGRGFFSSATTKDTKFDDFRADVPKMNGENFEKNYAALEKVKKIADAKKCDVSQLALAWVKHRADLLKEAGLVPIPGTTKEKNLSSNVATVDIILSDEDVFALEAAVPKEHISGERYGEGGFEHRFDRNKQLTAEEAAKIYG